MTALILNHSLEVSGRWARWGPPSCRHWLNTLSYSLYHQLFRQLLNSFLVVVFDLCDMVVPTTHNTLALRGYREIFSDNMFCDSASGNLIEIFVLISIFLLPVQCALVKRFRADNFCTIVLSEVRSVCPPYELGLTRARKTFWLYHQKIEKGESHKSLQALLLNILPVHVSMWPSFKCWLSASWEGGQLDQERMG